MELQSGLLGWQVEKLSKSTHSAGHTVSVRMGPFFRLTLELQEGGAMSGALELTQPGTHPAIAAYSVCSIFVACPSPGQGGCTFSPTGDKLHPSLQGI